MTKYLALGLFLAAATANATCWPGYTCPTPVPEPAAAAELAVCASGLGLLAWRLSRRSK